MPNYNEIKTEYIPNLREFTHGHSMHASIVMPNGIYAIYSYSTLVATYNLVTGEWWFTPHKYSQTTSRQMGVIREGANRLNAEAVEEVLRKHWIVSPLV
jgi:hypothetical protein